MSRGVSFRRPYRSSGSAPTTSSPQKGTLTLGGHGSMVFLPGAPWRVLGASECAGTRRRGGYSTAGTS